MAAGHRAVPGTGPVQASTAGIDVPRMYVRAIDALYVVWRRAWRRPGRRRGLPPLRRPPRPCYRVQSSATGPAYLRAIDGPTAGLPLIEDALRLFEQAPPSADHADGTGSTTLTCSSVPGLGQNRGQCSAVLNRALEIAEAAGATALIALVLARTGRSTRSCAGRSRKGSPSLSGGGLWPGPQEDGPALVRLAVERKRRTAQARPSSGAPRTSRWEYVRRARRPAWGASEVATILAVNASEALLACGCTAEAAALIEPLTRRLAGPGPLAGARGSRRDRPAARRYRCRCRAAAAD